MSFASFSLDATLLAGVRAAGYEQPTPIQSQAVPEVLAGRDLLGLARTGSGKTAAFVLPILQRLIQAKAPRRGPLRVLVLAPTRELALQIHETFASLGGRTGFRSAAVFGGVGMVPQLKALKSATVCVACPGRLLDLMNRGEADLSRVDTLVLDEADRMLDMGFLPDIRKILAALPAKRQNLLFSATMPQDMRELCGSILQDPAVVRVASDTPAASVSHSFYSVPQHLKADFLESLLKKTPHDCVLVFTRTKHKAKSLAQRLERRGWNATSLQGNLSQSRRQQALDGFRQGTFRIMVATDIAARGIDCERITHVVNFDMPDTAETYTHRIGRTGRVDRTGEAMTLVNSADKLPVRSIEHLLGRRITLQRLDDFDYDAPKTAQPVSRKPSTPASGKQARTGKPNRPAQPGKPSRGADKKSPTPKRIFLP